MNDTKGKKTISFKKVTMTLMSGLVLTTAGVTSVGTPVNAVSEYPVVQTRSCSFTYIRNHIQRITNKVTVRAYFYIKPNGDITRYASGSPFITKIVGYDSNNMRVSVWKPNNHMVTVELRNIRQGTTSGYRGCRVRFN